MDTSKKKGDERCKLNKIYRMETVGKSLKGGKTEGKFDEKQQRKHMKEEDNGQKESCHKY
jgi:hypothetical protein